MLCMPITSCEKTYKFHKMANLPKVLVTRSDFPEAGIKLLRDRCDVEICNYSREEISTEELLNKVIGKDALFISGRKKITKEVIECAAKNGVKVISTLSIGIDHIDIDAVKKTSIRIGYTPHGFEAPAELTVALLLATSRRVVEGHNLIVRDEWKMWTPTFMCGRGLHKSVVGLVGFGRIGQSVAKKLKAFETSKMLYSGPRRKPEGDRLGAEFVELDVLLRQSDFVIVTCPLTPETKGLFTAEKFSLMKPSAIFINTARGGIVDHDALVSALKNKIIAAAGLDVMVPEPLPKDHPLVNLDNCVLTPHIGSSTWGSRNEMCILSAKNILAVLDGEPMPAEYIL